MSVQGVIAKRLSNAFIRNVEPNTELLSAVATKLVLGAAKQWMGGLWVGGCTYLTRDALVFRPNAVNRAAHRGDCSVTIALEEIVELNKVFGFFTQIIDAKTATETLRFRCFRRDSFYAAILGQMQMKKIRQMGSI